MSDANKAQPLATNNDAGVEAPAAKAVAPAAAPLAPEAAAKKPLAKKKSPPEAIRSDWMRSYNLLLDFYKDTETTEMPNHLSEWTHKQNVSYTALIALLEGGKPSPPGTIPLNETQVQLLRKAGFVFQRVVVSTAREKSWNEKMELLVNYRNEHVGTCSTVQANAPAKFKGLANWISTQRCRVRDEKDPFYTAERIQRLRDVGVELKALTGGRKRKNPVPAVAAAASAAIAATPKPPKKPKFNPQKWDALFQEMKDFQQQNGHTHVPCTNQSLRTFLTNQRAEYKKLQEGEPSRLTADKVQKLNDIGFVWTAKRPFTFEERFQQWRDYRLHNDNKDPHRFSKDGLGKWISMIRSKYNAKNEGKTTNLTQDQIDLLNKHDFTWSVIQRPKSRVAPKTWDERFEELQAYAQQYGHCVVRQHQPGLGPWVHSQRMHYQLFQANKESSILNAERIAKLEQLGFVWDARHRRFGRNSDEKKKPPVREDSREFSERHQPTAVALADAQAARSVAYMSPQYTYVPSRNVGSPRF